MTNDNFIRYRATTTEARFNLCDAKSREYTRGNDDDRLCNFKRIAEVLGLNPLQTWAVYFGKHHDAVIEYIKTGREGTEGIYGRIDDMQNYLDLLRALVAEAETSPLKEALERNMGGPDGPIMESDDGAKLRDH